MRGIRWANALCVSLLLSACAASPPAIKDVPVNVPVIQVQKCIKKSDIPTRPEPLAKSAPSDLEVALSLALAKISEWYRYGERADAAMSACAE